MWKPWSQPPPSHVAGTAASELPLGWFLQPGTREARLVWSRLVFLFLLQCSSGAQAIPRADGGRVSGAIGGGVVLGGSW